MSKVEDRIEDYKRIKEIRDKGELLCIPFYKKFPMLAKSVPGIVKGIMYKITAGSGIGKTQFTKELFIITPLEYIRNNPQCNVNYKVIYFALEETEDEFIDSLMCNTLAHKFNVRIDPGMLKGYKEKYADSELLNMIEQCKPDVEFYLDHVEIVDSVYNPTGMYKLCRARSREQGTHYYTKLLGPESGITHIDHDSYDKLEKENKKEYKYSHYVPKDPNLHVVVVADHLSLLQEEWDYRSKKMLTQHQVMGKWSTEYGKRQITKHWDWTYVDVQQQEQSSEKEHFTNTGDSVQKKTEPQLNSLANNKEIQRDSYVVIAVYSPDRFKFKEYKGYNIELMRDTFRCAIVLKNRIGVPNKYIPMLFDGAVNRFNELPMPYDTEGLEKYYEISKELTGRKDI